MTSKTLAFSTRLPFSRMQTSGQVAAYMLFDPVTLTLAWWPWYESDFPKKYPHTKNKLSRSRHLKFTAGTGHTDMLFASGLDLDPMNMNLWAEDSEDEPRYQKQTFWVEAFQGSSLTEGHADTYGQTHHHAAFTGDNKNYGSCLSLITTFQKTTSSLLNMPSIHIHIRRANNIIILSKWRKAHNAITVLIQSISNTNVRKQHNQRVD